MLRVLILGGTTEARQLAMVLADRPGVAIVSSLAGRVRDPRLPPGEVRIGGFGGASGLAAWLCAERMGALVDATHPFASVISANAVAAAGEVGVPLLALRRPGWRKELGDDWRRVPSLAAAAEAVTGLGERVFLTTGRQDLSAFAALDWHWFLVRSVNPPRPPMPSRMSVIMARGPFTVDGDVALMREHAIDVLVTKDSGGKAAVAKLVAARQLGLPVVMVDRPVLPRVQSVETVSEAAAWVEFSRPSPSRWS